MTLLGLETSCDETSAAVVDDGGRVLSNVVLSQQDHAAYGGSSRSSPRGPTCAPCSPVVEQSLREADTALDDLDAVAVTFGPGLVGSLLVGVNFAKALAWGRQLDLIGVHHLEGTCSRPALTAAPAVVWRLPSSPSSSRGGTRS